MRRRTGRCVGPDGKGIDALRKNMAWMIDADPEVDVVLDPSQGEVLA